MKKPGRAASIFFAQRRLFSSSSGRSDTAAVAREATATVGAVNGGRVYGDRRAGGPCTRRRSRSPRRRAVPRASAKPSSAMRRLKAGRLLRSGSTIQTSHDAFACRPTNPASVAADIALVQQVAADDQVEAARRRRGRARASSGSTPRPSRRAGTSSAPGRSGAGSRARKSAVSG